MKNKLIASLAFLPLLSLTTPTFANNRFITAIEANWGDDAKVNHHWYYLDSTVSGCWSVRTVDNSIIATMQIAYVLQKAVALSISGDTCLITQARTV
ncbi:MAG TPA: hypothetical protein VGO76_14805 [Luteibacter sp.]|jgi:hypothetical protein|nr:hypothetical protein [Luteibacter sp.]